MGFKKLLLTAQKGDQEAQTELFHMYHPLIISRSMVDGRFMEELYQEMVLIFFHCIHSYSLKYRE